MRVGVGVRVGVGGGMVGVEVRIGVAVGPGVAKTGNVQEVRRKESVSSPANSQA